MSVVRQQPFHLELSSGKVPQVPCDQSNNPVDSDLNGAAKNTSCSSALRGDTCGVWTAGYPPSPWLHVEGSDIRVGTERWFVRGVNIPDPRSCGRCSPNTPAALDNATNEVICRMRVAVNTWKVQAFRLAVYTQPGQNSPSTDAAYVSALAKIVKEATENLNVYVIVGVQLDPSNDPDSTSDADAQQEIPNAGLVKVWQSLVPAFAANPRVLFGISNEPHCPWNDSQCQSSNNSNHDVQVRNGMATVVRAIRAAEFGSFSPYPHIILAQGCRNYAADISCYSQCGRLSDPQVAYEVHVYNAPLLLGSYDTQIFGPARNIPIVIGEIGPQNAANHKCPNKMTFDNLQEVLQVAEVNKVPYFGWTFHSTCVPNMLTSAAAGCNSCQQNINNILPIDDGIVPDVCGANWGCFAYKWLITSGNKTAPEGQSVSCKSFSRFPTAL